MERPAHGGGGVVDNTRRLGTKTRAALDFCDHVFSLECVCVCFFSLYGGGWLVMAVMTVVAVVDKIVMSAGRHGSVASRWL
jgi:hypothetical protein